MANLSFSSLQQFCNSRPRELFQNLTPLVSEENEGHAKPKSNRYKLRRPFGEIQAYGVYRREIIYRMGCNTLDAFASAWLLKEKMNDVSERQIRT